MANTFADNNVQPPSQPANVVCTTIMSNAHKWPTFADNNVQPSSQPANVQCMQYVHNPTTMMFNVYRRTMFGENNVQKWPSLMQATVMFMSVMLCSL